MVIITKKSNLIQKHILSFYKTKNPQRSFYDQVQDARGWDYEKNTFYYTPKHALKDLVAIKFYKSDDKTYTFLRTLGLSDNIIDKHRGGAYGLYRDLLVDEGAKMWSEINTETKKSGKESSKTKINRIIRGFRLRQSEILLIEHMLFILDLL